MSKHPKDMTEFAKEYGPRVRSTLMRMGVSNQDTLNDLEQDVYLRMIQNNTLGVFDAAKGSFTTHIYQVIRTVAFNHHRAVKRIPLDCAEPIQLGAAEDDGEFLHPEVAKICTRDSEADPNNEFLELLYKELAKFPAWKSGSAKKGETLKSLTVVCQLLYQGYAPKEIASVFKVGTSSVSVWVKKIRLVAKEVRTRHGF